MVRTPSTMAPLGTVAPDFDLPDTEGQQVARRDFDGQPLLVAFICNHCPYVQHVADRLATVTRDILAQGVAVVGINSNDPVAYPDDAPETMADEKEARGYAFPYLFDATQDVARAYRAACTPDFFLFDAQHRLVYRGQFDAARPGSPVPVTGDDLKRAVAAMLAGKTVPDQKPSLGCNIKWRPA